MTLGLQLYSMRTCADQIALLGALPAMGISSVEGYGGVYGDPDAYRAAMDANGITMPSGHMALDDIEADFDSALRLAQTLGMRHVFAPYLDAAQRPSTSAGYADLAHRLAAAAKGFADAGLSFGWHNHDFEFVQLADGGIPMDILLD
ncbi:MAG: sugar phosphate isomerase/epimerase, partial [Paracoccaceae bacterium]